MKLYELTSEFDRLRELADQAGTPEDEKAFLDTLAAVGGELDAKVDRIAALMAEFDADADALKNEEQRLEARRKAIESNRSRLSDYCLRCLQDAGLSKVKGARFTVLVAKNAPKVVIDDEKAIPEEFVKMEWVTTPQKALIAAAIKAGNTVPGVHMEQGESLRIR